CTDMEAVDRQLAGAKKMETYIDAKSGGNGTGWYRIVTSPQQARVVMEAGKLAVVLGVEVDYLFNCHAEGDLTADKLRIELDRYQALGVRHIFPIHFSDNGFGGTAAQNRLQRWSAIEDPFANVVPASPLNPAGTIPDAYLVYTDSIVIAGDPMGYVGAGAARVLYRGQDNHIHEIGLGGPEWAH